VLRRVLFWDLMQHRLVILYRHFGTTYWSYPQGSSPGVKYKLWGFKIWVLVVLLHHVMIMEAKNTCGLILSYFACWFSLNWCADCVYNYLLFTLYPLMIFCFNFVYNYYVFGSSIVLLVQMCNCVCVRHWVGLCWLCYELCVRSLVCSSHTTKCVD
jgi:hypothetical protein